VPRTTAEQKDCQINFRVTKTEKKLIEKKAKKEKVGISQYARMAVLER